jgi:hypothetical protein
MVGVVSSASLRAFPPPIYRWSKWRSEVDPDFGTRGLIGKVAVPLLNGADDDEAKQTDD